MIPSDAEFDRQMATNTKRRTADFDGWIFDYLAVYEGDEVKVTEVYSCHPAESVKMRAGEKTSDLHLDLVDTILKFEGESLYDLLEKNDGLRGEDLKAKQVAVDLTRQGAWQPRKAPIGGSNVKNQAP